MHKPWSHVRLEYYGLSQMQLPASIKK